MKQITFFSLIVILLISSVDARRKKKEDTGPSPKEIELRALKEELEDLRNSLQQTIAKRWQDKQKYIRQREVDKEELNVLRDQQERVYLDIARVKEEVFARERAISEESTVLQQKKEEWTYVSKSMGEVFEKEGEKILERFPLDREKRRQDLEALRTAYKETGKFIPALNGFADYKLQYIGEGSKMTMIKQTVIPEEGIAKELNIARFGNVFGYGMTGGNDLYFIRQTGLIGVNRFKIEKINEPNFNQIIKGEFPSWVQNNHPSGTILTDVLHNAHSGALISGEKTSGSSDFMAYMKAGGPIMFPLLLLPIWALILIILKLVQYQKKHSSGKKISAYVLDKLEHNEVTEAQEYVQHKNGIIPRVVKTCLDHKETDREAAEKAVKEIIIEEIPDLNKHLATLAIIAGVAPLLGLLGTVTGMINLFEVITNYGTGDPKIMAGGISEALITTKTGLTVAIPILLCHNFIRNKRDRIKADIEKNAIQIMNKLWPSVK